MPNLSRNDIKARIADGSIFAISIDTAIFDGLQGQFDNAVLKRLDQFHVRDVRVVFSEIVAREIKRHVALSAKETQRALKKALRRHTNRWKLPAPDDAGDPLAIKAGLFIEVMAHITSSGIQCAIRFQQGRLVIQRFTRVGDKDGGNIERLAIPCLHDEGR